MGGFIGRGNHRCKAPEAVVYLEGSRKSQEDSMAEVEGTRGRVVDKMTEK